MALLIEKREELYLIVEYYIYHNIFCCQRYSTSHIEHVFDKYHVFSAPGPPSDFNVYRVMTNRFLLTWKSPAVEFQNGVIRSYHVEIIENRGGFVFNKSIETADPFLLMNSLLEGHTYTFRVAAYTNTLGKFSNVTERTLPQGVCMHAYIIFSTMEILITMQREF